MKKRLILFALLGIGLVGITFVYLANRDWRRPDASVVLQFDLSKIREQIRAEIMSIAIEQSDRRAKRLGCEYKIKDLGQGKIRIQVFGQPKIEISDIKQFLAGPRLEFRLVHPQLFLLSEPPAKSAIPPGYEVLEMKTADKNHQEYSTYSAVRIKPEMEDDDVASAIPEKDELGYNQIRLHFTPTGAQRFTDITTANPDSFLAIVFDGQLFSMPRIRGRIETDTALISGSFNEREAMGLSIVLNSPLRIPAKVISE